MGTICHFYRSFFPFKWASIGVNPAPDELPDQRFRRDQLRVDRDEVPQGLHHVVELLIPFVVLGHQLQRLPQGLGIIGEQSAARSP